MSSLFSILCIASLQAVSTNSIPEKRPSIEDKIIVSNDIKSSDSIAADILFSFALDESLSREEKIMGYSNFTSYKSRALSKSNLKYTTLVAAKTIPAITLYYDEISLEEIETRLIDYFDYYEIESIILRRISTYSSLDGTYHMGDFVENEQVKDRQDDRSFVDYRNIPYDRYEPTTYTGQGVKIGVVESGPIDPNHWNFSDTTIHLVNVGTKDSSIDTTLNHADEVLSVLTGKYGLAPRAEIYLINGDLYPYSGYHYLDYFAYVGVDVVNLSLGSDGTFFHPYCNYITYAYQIPLVASCNNETYEYLEQPASAQNVISVCSVNTDYTIASGSNIRDPNDNHGVSNNFRIAAVGGHRSTNVYGITDDLCGTSFAAPAVTGTIALMMEKNPSMKGDVALVMATLSNGADNTLVDPTIPSEYGVYDSLPDTLSGLRSWSGVGCLDIRQTMWLAGFAATPYVNLTSYSESYLFDINDVQPGQRLYTSHAWLQKVNIGAVTYIEDTLSDYDLRLYDSYNNLLYQTYASDVNVERHFYTFSSAGNYIMKVKTYYSSYTTNGRYSVVCHRAI